jgi:hypothetical protein
VNQRIALPSILVALVVVPFGWLACGGKTPPADEPGAEGASASAGGEETPPASAASADMPPAATDTAPPAASSAPPATPPTPAFSDTDCGKCVATACAKQEKACNKDTGCKSALDGMHSCTGTLATCVDGATPPSDKGPKKLATAYVTCADKSVKKTCKAQCK